MAGFIFFKNFLTSPYCFLPITCFPHFLCTMHTRLTIPERLKDLRVAEKRMSLQELSDATGIPSSTLGNYEKDENVDMSLGNLLKLADFYQVSTDYLLCRTELREHTNKSVSNLHLNDDAVQILTDEKYNPRLLSENAFLDVMRYKLNELGTDSTNAFTKIFDTSHIETEQYYINILLEDLNYPFSKQATEHYPYVACFIYDYFHYKV